MGYNLHLERVEDNDTAEVSLEEWLAALEVVEGVRPAESDAVARNPNTGEEIRIPKQPGDAEIHFPEDGAWHLIISFSHGRARLRHPGTWNSGAEIAWRVIADLCTRLNLVAVGEEGERYDPATGELVGE